MVNLRYYQVSILVVCSLFVGCKFYPEQSNAKPINRVYTNNKASQVNTQPVSAKQKTVNHLLAEAEYALSQNRLLLPIEDNAFDRFQSVLLLEPGNKSARTGLQTISLRYVELARASIGRAQYAQAQAYIKNARDVDPQSPLLAEAQAQLQRAKAAQPPVAAYQPGPNEHLLNAQELSRKSSAIIAQLTHLAKKAQTTGDLVIIFARNDAEGRWVYGQMRDALGDYLLRGDIKIATQPRIQFVPAL